MKEHIGDKKAAYHLNEYVILEDEDGTYEYVSWDPDKKTGKLSWIRGIAVMLEDILCMTSITSDGDEEAFETEFELKIELEQLPKWDKTKYYGIVLQDANAGRFKYSEKGAIVQKDGEDYKALQETFKTQGITLL